jgi:hypothetical protein
VLFKLYELLKNLLQAKLIKISRSQWASQEDGRNAIEEALNGAKIVHLVSKYGIPDKTLMRMIQRHQNGEEKKKPGPQPIIGEEAETDLFEWVVGMQKQDFPVSWDMLIVKANQIYQELFGNLRSSGSIGRGVARALFFTLSTAHIAYVTSY